MIRGIQLFLAAAGVALLIALVRAVGVREIGEALRPLGVGIAVVVALELLVDACNTRGWQATMRPGLRLGFWRLYWVRQAGTAVNQLTPTASVGGELVKAMLLRRRMDAPDLVASLVVAKFSLAVAQATLILCSLAIVVQRLGDTPELMTAVLLVFSATLLALGAFFLAQHRGWMGRVVTLATLVAPRARLVLALRKHATALDESLQDVYRRRPRAAVVAVLWHFAGQLVSVLQLWLILAALSASVSVSTCLAIEAASLVLDAATFLVPARIGVQEGGRMLVFTTIGLDAATGLAAAIVVRVTQLTVSAVGLAAFAYFSWARMPVGGSISDI